MAVTTANLVVGNATVSISGTGDLGSIKDGVTLTPTIELFTIDGIEQQLTPTKAWRTSEKWEVAFTLVEPTQANMAFAWDTDNAPAAGPPVTLKVGDHQFIPTQRAITITGYVPGGTFVRSLILHRCVLSAAAPYKVTKNEESNMACSFMLLYDDTTNNCVFTVSDATS